MAWTCEASHCQNWQEAKSLSPRNVAILRYQESLPKARRLSKLKRSTTAVSRLRVVRGVVFANRASGKLAASQLASIFRNENFWTKLWLNRNSLEADSCQGPALYQLETYSTHVRHPSGYPGSVAMLEDTGLCSVKEPKLESLCHPISVEVF